MAIQQAMDATLGQLQADTGEAEHTAHAHRLTALVESQFSLVWRSLRRLGLSEADADDATQQVFVVAGRKLDQIESGRERAFLVGVAVRVARDTRRSQRRQRILPDADPDDHLDSQPTPDRALENRQFVELLDVLLEGLDPSARAVFVLYEVQELTMAEIAEALKIPAGTVASRLRRGRNEFKAALMRHRQSTQPGVRP
jgi:RNA polymerase sigma-70 factor (ECF subfamily)